MLAPAFSASNALRRISKAGASKEKQYHLKRQILPGISAYETLQRVMPKEEALQTVHGFKKEDQKRFADLFRKLDAEIRAVPGGHVGFIVQAERYLDLMETFLQRNGI